MYHLRQDKPLTQKFQDNYFNETVARLFDQDKPNQILFSYLKNDKCIGYGGLVHINWIERKAEVSFIMETSLEENEFDLHWSTYLYLLKKIAFGDLKLNSISTFNKKYFSKENSIYTFKEDILFNKNSFSSNINQFLEIFPLITLTKITTPK